MEIINRTEAIFMEMCENILLLLLSPFMMQ